MTVFQQLGAGSFGLFIGWYVYYVNRHRKGEVQLTDLGTLIGIVGGGAVLALFPAGTDLFAAYGLGLAAGFFLYFVVLVAMVARSQRFTVDWFLDGRRPKLTAEEEMVEGAPAPMGGGQRVQLPKD